MNKYNIWDGGSGVGSEVDQPYILAINTSVTDINFIMSTSANSFRLQRLTKTVGIKDQASTEYSPKETLKLAAINSINRSIKYNDMSFVSGKTDLNKLRKEPQLGGDIEYESAHHNLDTVRKNFDSMHKEKVKKELSISKLKDEKRKFSVIESEFLENKEKGGQKVKDLNGEKQKIKLMLSEADIQKKVLLHMRDRLKHDKVVYDLRKFNMEKQLKFLKTQADIFKRDGTQINEEEDRTSKVYRKFLKQLNTQREERQAHLDSLEYMIEEKRKVNQINEYRSKQIMEIAERAMQDKDESEKKWEKLYLTNKFLARMLRDKMDKEMNKFFVVQSAFKNIKIATGVNSAETLVQKFLNKEVAYGDLLGRIAENQKKIEVLKYETEDLLHEHKELEAEREVLDHTKKVIPEIESQSKEMNDVSSKSKRTNLLKEKLRNWVVKTLKKVNLIMGTKHNVSIGRQEKETSEAFLSYLSVLSQEVKKAQEAEAQKQKFDENQKIKNIKKSIRISHMNKDPYEDESEEQPTTNLEQNDLMLGQRSDIHRQNEKFMKDLKRKAQELRKAKAEAMMPKKKEEKAPEKPKEQVE